LTAFHAQLNRDLRELEFQNNELNEQLRQDAIDAEIEQYNTAFDMEYSAVVAQNERLGRLGIERNAVEQQRRKEDLANQALYEQQKIGFVEFGAASAISTLQNLNTLADGENRTYFEALKAARISEAIINTYTGATKAWQLFGPFGAPAAALVIASGLAQVAVIASQSYEGGGSTGGAGAGATVSPGTPPAELPVESALPEQERAQNVTVIINNPLGNEDWDQLAEDNIIPAFRRANRRNIQTTFD
jgi:hypothetical protein